jgi:hypothetical protein
MFISFFSCCQIGFSPIQHEKNVSLLPPQHTQDAHTILFFFCFCCFFSKYYFVTIKKKKNQVREKERENSEELFDFWMSFFLFIFSFEMTQKLNEMGGGPSFLPEEEGLYCTDVV